MNVHLFTVPAWLKGNQRQDSPANAGCCLLKTRLRKRSCSFKSGLQMFACTNRGSFVDPPVVCEPGEPGGCSRLSERAEEESSGSRRRHSHAAPAVTTTSAHSGMTFQMEPNVSGRAQRFFGDFQTSWSKIEGREAVKWNKIERCGKNKRNLF